MIGFSIIFISILLSVAFYWYAYIFNIAYVTVESNQWNFSLSLETPQQIIQKSCEEKSCDIGQIPPFDFKVIAKKSGYQDIQKNIKFSRNISQITLDFQKDFTPIAISKTLNESDQEVLSSLSNNQSIIDQKREELKKQKDLYFLEKIDKNQYYFYDKNPKDNLLTLWKNDRNLWNIPLIQKENIKIIEIIWSDNEFLIQSDSGYKLFQIWNNNISDFLFQIDIIYMKKSEAQKYIIVTNKWSFLWNKAKNTFNYNHLYDDFVEYDWGYIWVIFQNNSTVKNKYFSDENYSWNLIYKYSPKTKSKEILFSGDINIQKMFFRNSQIIIQNKQNEEFYIPHITK